MRLRIILVCVVLLAFPLLTRAQEIPIGEPETTPAPTDVIPTETPSTAAEDDASNDSSTSTDAVAETTPTEAAPPIDAASGDVLEAYIVSSDDTPNLGQQVELTIVIEASNAVTITEFPEFPPDDRFFDVLDTSEWEETASGETITYRQTLTGIIWKVGEYLSPELTVAYQVDGSGERFAPVRSVFLAIPRLITTTETAELRPYLPSVLMDYRSPWWYVLAVFGGVVIVWLLLAVTLRRGDGSKPRSISRSNRGTPAQVSIAQLEDLQGQNLNARTIFPSIAIVLRLYLQAQHSVNITDLTTSELLDTLQSRNLLEPSLRGRLRNILQDTDLVKFAGFIPPDDATTQELIEKAIQWLRDDERNTRERGTTRNMKSIKVKVDWSNTEELETSLKDAWKEALAEQPNDFPE